MPKYGPKPRLELLAGDEGCLKYYYSFSCCGTIVIVDGRDGNGDPRLYPCPVCRPTENFPFEYVEPQDACSHMIPAPSIED